MRAAALLAPDTDTEEEVDDTQTETLTLELTPDPTSSTSPTISPERLAIVSSLLGRGRYKPIARAAGMNARNVSMILRGLRSCFVDTAVRISTAAGVSLDEFQVFVEMKRRENEIKLEGVISNE